MKETNKYLGFILLMGISLLLSFSSCKKDETEQSMNIAQVAASDSDFTILVEALKKAGIISAFETYSPITVFAPTNEAFTALFNDLGVSGLDDLSAETLSPILFYHVLGAKVTSNDLFNGYAVTLSSGPNLSGLSILINADEVTLNSDINITKADIFASNGMIHVIDKVLLPPTVGDLAVQNGGFTHLVEAVVKAELDSTLSGTGLFTIFAPTDAAFETLFTNLGIGGIADLSKEELLPILQYHVVSGNVRSSNLTSGNVSTLNGTISIQISNPVTINNTSNILAVDIQGTNGVIHVIDAVLQPGTK